MKKLVSVLCILALVFALAPAAFAEWDLSGLSFDDLVALRDQAQRVMWESADWQEVEVPQGVWEVGADIPAGKWTILPTPFADTYIKIGNETQNSGTEVKSKVSQRIKDKDYKDFDASKDITSWNVDLEEGQFLQVSYGPCIFTPYAGKPSLGFK